MTHNTKMNKVADIFSKKFDRLNGFGGNKAYHDNRLRFETLLELIEEISFSIESVRILSTKAEDAAQRIFSTQASPFIERIKEWKEKREKAHNVISKF